MNISETDEFYIRAYGQKQGFTYSDKVARQLRENQKIIFGAMWGSGCP